MNKLYRYFDAVTAIRAHGTSTGGWVNVTRAEDGHLDVRVRPGMLRRLDEREVAAEIRTALLAALADHRRQYVRLRLDYFGSPVGAATTELNEIANTTGPS
ncbi:hypothetical protein [Actinoplanes sp. NPDC049316]|uniref:hypothetical protein n=1 Tax=Actinoplanes sp. NPDC049316 TaxID=3154727 RepID=UPI00342A4208